MSAVGDFVGDVVGDVVGGITGAKQAGEAAAAAGETQAAAAMAGVEEQRRQFDKLVELMSPYVTAGEEAMAAQQALIGLGTPEEQQAAISTISASPEYHEMVRQGEEAMLQRASATGGLRGGDIQGALAQFRPQILSDLINRQYSRLGGFTRLGQASATGQASAGMQSAGNIASLLGQRGAAIAGGQLGQGSVVGQTFGDLLSIGGGIAKMKTGGLF